MANFYCEHLTIIDEWEVEYNIRHFSSLVVLANTAPSPETPPPVLYQINRSALRDAVLHHTGVEILLESISCYLNSYLLLTRSTEEATRILAVPFIYIGEHALAIAPWTPSFGATRIPFDENLPRQPLTPARCPRSSQNLVPLHLVISGMPLHLFAQ